MIKQGDSILVALSGGPDSMCLVNVLSEFAKDFSLRIVAANMDHGIRGAESVSDSIFTEKVSREMGLEYVHKKENIRKTKKSSMEEVAREKRYAFFKKAALDYKCGIIATGHTLDDQAETILMRIIKGSSIRGLLGIAPVISADSVRIIRPLINTSKDDILAFLKYEKIPYCIDRTNIDKKILRNRIRHELLPYLESYNPRIKRSLVNMAASISEDMDFIEAKKNEIGKMSLTSKIRDLLIQPESVRKEIFKNLYEEAGGDLKKLTYRHWKNMDYFLRTSGIGKALDLPGRVKVTKTKDSIEFTKKV